ncbi:PqqD family protein [Erythrobacter sp. R86502]|uniref:PqqD family protein n=1 Tax=Erythrobacter sp. R86502 TaxID=3093846 RepID=UPI0036D26841
MSDVLETRWRVSDQAIANAVADETVILHLGNGTYYGLDPIGALLWKALVEGDVPASICDSILETYDVEPQQLAADLRALLNDLVDNELVEPA